MLYDVGESIVWLANSYRQKKLDFLL